MFKNKELITIGFSPCWDITCQVASLKWGDHKQIDTKTSIPAGKALNVSRALAMLSVPSIATGLWSSIDNKQMVEAVTRFSDLITIRHALVKGTTRQNITIVDTHNHREIHLTSPNELVNSQSIKAVEKSLKTVASDSTVCIFAGSLPDDSHIEDIGELFQTVKNSGAQIVLDTSGAPLQQLIASGNVAMISPNVDELSGLLGKKIQDSPSAIINAAKPLLKKVDLILVSRGGNGAMAISKNEIVQAKCTNLSAGNVTSTVGCGDYLLAGFLAGLKQTGSIDHAIKKGVTLATAKAWGLDSDLSYEELKKAITVKTRHN